jgi:imidazolonepropionase-like amidohydrolase
MNIPTLVTLALGAGVGHAALGADPLAPRPNGPMPAPPSLHLIDNATVHTAPGAEPAVMDILVRDGRIERIAGTIEPGAARVWDAEGLHVYAGFIDAYVPVAAGAVGADTPGAHWSALVTPHRDAIAGAGLPAGDATNLRKLGFAAANIAPDAGIFRGWSGVVSTAEPFSDPALGKPPVYRARAAQHLGFERAGWNEGGYPTSHMGVIALLRQTFLDTAHRARAEHADASVLDHIDPDALMIYDTSFELEALLADKVGAEFGHERVAVVGSGNEFRRLDALAEAGRPIIAPLIQPNTPDVWSVGAADSVSLDELAAWEQGPANPRWLAEKGLQVSLTSSKLPRNQNFWTNLHQAIDAGLTPEQAHAMLTTNPADLLGVSDTLGTVEAGKHANLIVATAPLFHASDAKGDTKAEILSVWVDGRHHKINDRKDTRFDGEWTVTVLGAGHEMGMTIKGTKVTSHEGDEKTDARKVVIKGDRISFLIDDENERTAGSYLISGILGPDGVIRGTGIAPDQSVFEWTGAKSEAPAEPAEEAEAEAEKPVPSDDFVAESDEEGEDGEEGEEADAEESPDAGARPAPPGRSGRARAGRGDAPKREPPAMPAGAPFAQYTVEAYPDAENFLLVNATVWTQSDRGTIENGWVLIRDGKIAQIGSGGYPRIAATVIDCEGKHITPGLIDAHSHTGLFRLGVNESGQAVTSEVRIADSLDPGHINFYRQLAGGVTSVNLLHGSANPIGGQSQTVKLRWGALRPEDMLFEGAKPGIKFALGENVKQSNWGDRNTSRYPQTRLGVETIIRDRFTKAREYGIERGILKADTGGSTRAGSFLATQPPASTPRRAANPDDLPRDLELEILAEILSGDRLVHCHSYRQDEILMLCRVAEDFGFKIGTFQHGLETYKVAEVVREHAIGASIFSDWWAYKVEVQDAIPAAGPINFEAGLMTSYNSDSDELARRMNAEAGKAYRYAREAGIELSREDALSFVTRNPAVQLGIIDRVGTIETGKDADLVVWSGDPISSLTRAERTFVDGRQLFSPEIDAAHRERNRAERTRLLEKIMKEGRPEPKKDEAEKPDPESPESGEEPPTRRSLLARTYEAALQEHIDHGTRPGDCGCNLLPRELMRTID